MVNKKKNNKQWSDIWIESDGVHMLKMTYDSIFNGNAPDYISDDYVISFENITKLKKLDYKKKCVMLASLKDSSVLIEVPVTSFDDRLILKKNMLHKTVGTKRKTAILIAAVVLVFCLANVDYANLFKKLNESAKHIDLQRASIEYKGSR
ncbi:MAG: hypothetical protein IJ809_06735 [Clostridia bacterium]|nr:hypothetical protein [Clostridia bacterium]